MRNGAHVFRIIGAAVALQAGLSSAALASDGGDPAQRARQAGEDRWVPSLAITSGVHIQNQKGQARSLLFEDMGPDPIAERPFVNGTDTAVAPFVGGSLELMSPALSIPTRPRFFVMGEILPTFAFERDVALEGDPGCVRGPRPGAPCARTGMAVFDFGENAANGQGSKTSAEIDTVVFGASLGVAFPLQVGKRQLRIKPSVGWMNYEVDASGVVVDAECDPPDRCVGVGGFLRETVLSAEDSQRFNAIGPGLDVEMDTGLHGPLGVALFMGGRAYAVVGDRTISFESRRVYDDQLGTDLAVGRFEVEVDPWIFRAHVGIRFYLLGD